MISMILYVLVVGDGHHRWVCIVWKIGVLFRIENVET